MICSNCGNPIGEGDTFCHCCGAPLEEEQAQEVEQPKRKYLAVIAAAAALVAIVGAGAVWYLNGGRQGAGAGEGKTVEEGKTLGEGESAEEGKTLGEGEAVEEGKTLGEGESVEEGEALGEGESAEEDTDPASAQEQPEAGESEGAENVGSVEAPALSAWDYAAICEEIRQTDCIMTEKQDTMRDMLNALTDSKMLAYQSAFCCSDLSEEELWKLCWWIMLSFGLPGTESAPAEYGTYVEGESLNLFLEDYLGARIDDWSAAAGEMRVEEGGKEMLLFPSADEDSWLFGYGCDVRENAGFYLVSMPCFYGDVSGTDNLFQYYVEALFAKNEVSRFGVTLCYVETHAEGKDVHYAEVSSMLPTYKNKSYGGDRLIDGNISTPWVEGVDGNGEGQTIVLHLAAPERVYGILVYGGYLESEYLYGINGKPTNIKVDFGNGAVVEQRLDNGSRFRDGSVALQRPDRVQLSQSVVTDTITITILEAEAGSKYQDTCISEMIVY